MIRITLGSKFLMKKFSQVFSNVLKKVRYSYLKNITVLMLKYAYHNRSQKKFFKIINNETDIYRKLDLYDQKKINLN